MHCDFCQEEATVFYSKIEDGLEQKIALCGACAKERGIGEPGHFFSEQPGGSALGEIISDVASSIQEGSSGETGSLGEGSLVCGECEFPLQTFCKTGRLGCPRCYIAFDEEVGARLRGLHKACRHTGHVPEKLRDHFERRRHLAKLLKRLDDAILVEDYEAAATLKEEIKALEDAKGTEKAIPAP